MFAQSPGLLAQGVGVAARDQQRLPNQGGLLLVGLRGVRFRGRLFDDDVGVCAGDAERGHAGPTRTVAEHPGPCFCEQLDGVLRPVDLCRWRLSMQRARERAVNSYGWKNSLRLIKGVLDK